MRAGDSVCIEKVRSIMEHQVYQLTRLIDDLLDISRLNVGKLDMRRSPVSLTAVLQVVSDSPRPVMEEAQHEFFYQSPSEPMEVEGDETRLTQIFVNLLTNAVKYTPQGGRIQLSVRTDASEVTVTVADNGIGIPAEMKERILNIFVQGDQSAEKSHYGLGIGLTLVKSLVAMHHGRIEVESHGPNQGSKFLVHLPLADTTTKPRSRPTSVATSH